MNDIPVLDTPRLVLRGHVLADFEDCAAMWGNPDVTRHIGGRPFSTEEVWSRLLRYNGHWSLLGFGYWCVRERATDRFLGEVGFADFHRQIEPALDGPELGWVLAPHAQGQGYATEAVQRALAWAEATLAAPEATCIIDPGNVASLRVAAKVGFREKARTTYHGEPTVMFTRPLRHSAMHT